MSNQSFKTRVLFSAAGHVPPQEAVEKLMDDHKSFLGFAASTAPEDTSGDAQNVLESFCNDQDDYPPIKEVMEQLEAYKADPCFLIFGDQTSKVEGDDEQPFVILRADPKDEESDVIALAFIDGEFPNFAKDGDNPFAVVAEILRGTLTRFMEQCEDIDELIEAIETDPAIPKLIKGLYDKRATITLFFENGTQLELAKDGNPDRFELPDGAGWISHPEGYGKQTVVERVKRTFGGKGKGAAVSAEKKGESEQAGSKGERAGADNSASLYVTVAPPEWCKGKENRRSFYKAVNSGMVPSGFKDGPEVKVLRSAYDSWVKANTPKHLANVEPISSQTKTEPETILKATPPEVTAHKEFMKRVTPAAIVTNEGKTIIDPKRYETVEADLAKYSEVAGLPSTISIFAYTPEDVYTLITKHPKLATMAMYEVMGYAVERTPAELLNPKQEETKEKEAQPQASTGTEGGKRRFGGRK